MILVVHGLSKKRYKWVYTSLIICYIFVQNITMENKHIKHTADAIMHFSTYLLTGSSDPRHFTNPAVVIYAMDYVIRTIKEQRHDESFAEHYREVFWYIADNFKNH
jgi:hypothetical protein